MKKITVLCFFISMLFGYTQEKTSTKPIPNYKLAERFSPENLSKIVHSTSVEPNWLKRGNRFWYHYKTSNGTNYYLVDADKKTKTKLFDNGKMAKWLSEITKDAYDAKHLPNLNFEFVKNETAIRFMVTSNEQVVIKQNDTIKTTPATENKSYYLEYKIDSNKLTILKQETDKTKPDAYWLNIAPDSSIVMYGKNHNVYWMDKENYLKAVKNEHDSTIVEHQWTKDGIEDNSYSESGSNYKHSLYGRWSKNSKYFVLQRTDMRDIKDIWVINAAKEGRPTLRTFKYHMAGEPEYEKGEIAVFNTQNKKVVKIKLDTTAQQKVFIYRMMENSDKICYGTLSRDNKKVDVYLADLDTGESKKIIEDHTNTYIDGSGYGIQFINNESQILYKTEKDGWAHYYLHESNGKLKRQITNGEFHVDRFISFDEKTQTLFFTATGVNKNENPYYSHLYKINLNGTNMKSLNKGDFNTTISIANSNQYFVNNYSTVNSIPKSDLRDKNGNLIMKLEEADLSQLFAAGYKFPEQFKVKADDGITDIYGVLYKPYDFDSTKVYPIIEYVYPGPSDEGFNKSFSIAEIDLKDRLAQLGFIVITSGNRGGDPLRSKWYHTYGYGNLRDYGLADRKYVAEQLAYTRPFMNIDKVGIHGHSGGGFMTAAAMLVYPDFFKVGFSSAGNHDNYAYNSWWTEKHHGIKEVKDADGKITYDYSIDTNPSIAKNLKGRLMLITGDVDTNVHPTSTIRLINALIQANKRFDFMLFPNSNHTIADKEYVFWLRADYFIEHLLGITRKGADITEMNRGIPLKK